MPDLTFENLREFLQPQRDSQFATDLVAEGVGFEPTVACTTPVFKTGLFVHSSTPPQHS